MNQQQFDSPNTPLVQNWIPETTALFRSSSWPGRVRAIPVLKSETLGTVRSPPRENLLDSLREMVGSSFCTFPLSYCTVNSTGFRVVERPPESMATTVTTCVPTERLVAG